MPPPRAGADFDELDVTLKAVLGYGDPQALVWFTLLLFRNVRKLSPVYGAVAVGSVFGGLVTSSVLLDFLQEFQFTDVAGVPLPQ